MLAGRSDEAVVLASEYARALAGSLPDAAVGFESGLRVKLYRSLLIVGVAGVLGWFETLVELEAALLMVDVNEGTRLGLR